MVKGMIKKEHKKYIVYGVMLLVLIILGIAILKDKSIETEEDMLSELEPIDEPVLEVSSTKELVVNTTSSFVDSTFESIKEMMPLLVISFIIMHILGIFGKAFFINGDNK